MPGTYPAAPPTISGDLETISRFLQSPTQIRRRLRDYRDLRFISDQVLTGRFNTAGGAALYELSEPFVTDRAVESVAPGSEYPMANLPSGTAGIAAVAKWGQKVPLTDEEISRNVYGQTVVDRCLRKVVNTIISQVDTVTMSAMSSAVTQHVDAGDAWNGQTSTNILRDLLLAKKAITDLKMGYNPDSVLVDDLMYAYMMSDEKITAALQRETSASPVYTGQIERIAGLVILHSPNAPTHPYVFDSTQLGGMADEQAAPAGYNVADLAVQVKSIRKEELDAWHLQGRRITVPIVQEPGAGCYIDDADLTA
jgi:hypothetical protein